MRCLRSLVLALGLWGVAFGCASPVAEHEPKADAGQPVVRVRKVVFGVPIFGMGDEIGAWEPLAARIRRELHIEVELRAAEPYIELPLLFRSGLVDIAQLPPLAYAQIKANDPRTRPLATPIISGSPTYLGHFYVRADSPFRTLADLRGKRVAYVSSGSSSGYLFPRDVLRQNQFDPDSFFASTRFFKTHVQVLEAVAAGDVDAGAAIDSTTDWSETPKLPHDLRVVAKTARIPNDCVAARGGFDENTAVAIREIFMALRPSDPSAEEILSRLRVNGWVKADEARYDKVRQVLEREGRSPPRD